MNADAAFSHTTAHPPDCLARVHAEIRQVFRQLDLRSPAPILLAVSGGPDSLCMTDALLALQVELSIAPTLAHLNHGLRGDDARADAEFVRAYAEAHGTPCIAAQADVAALAREQHLSIEAAARMARYRFLAGAAESIGARHVALAHNADDQAETVLLRLLRGTGISGLRGMRPIAPLRAESSDGEPGVLLVRPLLNVSRADIECYCETQRLLPRRDLTNDQLHHTRNRIRHELLPLLEQYNPGIRKVLTRLAETAASDMQIVETTTRQAFASVLIGGAAPGQAELTLDRLAWRALPIGLQRAVLREAVRHIKGDVTNLRFAAVEEALNVLNSPARAGEIAILANLRIIVTPKSFRFQSPIMTPPWQNPKSP